MKRIRFEEGIAEIEEVIQKQYELSYVALIWKKFRTVEDEQWALMVKHFEEHRQSRSLPLIPNFYAAKRQAYEYRSAQHHVNVECAECKGLGLRYYIGTFCSAFPDSVYVRVARCICMNASNWSDAIPGIGRIRDLNGLIKIIGPFETVPEEVWEAEGKPEHVAGEALEPGEVVSKASDEIGRPVPLVSRQSPQEQEAERQRQKQDIEDIPF